MRYQKERYKINAFPISIKANQETTDLVHPAPSSGTKASKGTNEEIWWKGTVTSSATVLSNCLFLFPFCIVILIRLVIRMDAYNAMLCYV